MAGALGGCGTLHPSSARYVCQCVHHPRLLWNVCHPLSHSRASSDAITVLWTVLTQEGCLDIQPLPFGMAFPLSPPSQDTGPQPTSLSLHPPLCPHFLLPSLPQLPLRTQDRGWLTVTRVRQSCLLLLLGCPVHFEQDGTTVPLTQPTVWG